jgi:hypothetical protein
VSVSRILSYIVVFTSLTPWANWGTNSLDSQPWPALASALYLFAVRRTATYPVEFGSFFYCYSLTVIIVAFFSINSELFLIIRAFAGYFGLMLVFLAFYDILKRYGFQEKLFIFVNLLWLIIAIIEIWLPEFVSSISITRTSAGRGVTSLAPEPTFFAIYLIFSSWLLLVGRDYKVSKSISIILVANILAIIFLARSSMGLLFLCVAGLIYVIYSICVRKIQISSIILVCFALFLSIYFIEIFLADTRLLNMITLVSGTSFIDVARVDASINARLEHVILPFHAMVENIFLPYGYYGFSETRNLLIQYYDGFFWYGGGDKIMSWIGSFVFDMGLVGLMLVFGFLSLAMNIRGWRRRWEVTLLFFYLLAAIPIGFTLVPLLVAAMCFSGLRHERFSLTVPV